MGGYEFAGHYIDSTGGWTCPGCGGRVGMHQVHYCPGRQDGEEYTQASTITWGYADVDYDKIREIVREEFLKIADYVSNEDIAAVEEVMEKAKKYDNLIAFLKTIGFDLDEEEDNSDP